MKSSVIVLGSILLGLSSLAYAGKESSGGGDLCENRIKQVRDDLASWIKKGGPQGLSLPHGVDARHYSEAMSEQIKAAKIRCVAAGDPDFPVQINGTPKVCRFDSKPEGGQITCDYNKLLAASESGQYVLIHHEYAGLASLEIPNKDDSHYEISNQITKYLQNQTVKKLVVKPVPVRAVPCSSVDLLKQSGGFVCTTSVGLRYELMEVEGFGKFWKGPDQLVWSDVLGSATLEGASQACAKLGMALPSDEDFERGRVNGFQEVLPNLNGDKFNYWSRTLTQKREKVYPCYYNDAPFSYEANCTKAYYEASYYNGSSGRVSTTRYSDDSVSLFRCVAFDSDQ